MADATPIGSILASSVFLLGAGFSRPAGCLTSKEMLTELRKLLIGGTRHGCDHDKPNADSIGTRLSRVETDALVFLIACLEYQGVWRSAESNTNLVLEPNIEELAQLIRRARNRDSFVPYPVTGGWADKIMQFEDQFQNQFGRDENLLASIETWLRKRMLNCWLRFEYANCTYLEPLVDCLRNVAGKTDPLQMFTLNYDNSFRQYCESKRVRVWHGFHDGVWHGVKHRNADAGRRDVDLFNLHGSANWVRLMDMDTWEGDKLSENGSEPNRASVDLSHSPYIIFGHGAKQFSAEPFFSMIHHFYSVMLANQTKYIFVIGYSFFDPYINNLLFNAIRSKRQLIIVNPNFITEDIFQTETRNGQNRIVPNMNRYWQAEYNEGYNKSHVVEAFGEVQTNHFLSELPEFNNTKPVADNIHYIPLCTEDFLENYFGNEGVVLRQFVDSIDRAEVPIVGEDT